MYYKFSLSPDPSPVREGGDKYEDVRLAVNGFAGSPLLQSSPLLGEGLGVRPVGVSLFKHLVNL